MCVYNEARLLLKALSPTADVAAVIIWINVSLKALF